MRLAIADPPYPPHIGSTFDRPRGSRWYGEANSYTLGRGCAPADLHAQAQEWDSAARHRQLIEELHASYDGFAIATSADGIKAYQPLMRAARVMIWVKPNAMPGPGRIHSKYEAVILYPPVGRRSSRGGVGCVPDVLIAPKQNTGFAGAKPAEWTEWVLDALSYDPKTDTVDDLFPGSGAVGDVIAQRVLL